MFRCCNFNLRCNSVLIIAGFLNYFCFILCHLPEVAAKVLNLDRNYYYMERSYGSFSRVIPLETPIESGKAQASFKNGILDVKIPKNQSAKAKETKIPIKTA